MRNVIATDNNESSGNATNVINLPNSNTPNVIDLTLEDKINDTVESIRYILIEDVKFNKEFTAILMDFKKGGTDYGKSLKELLEAKGISFEDFDDKEKIHYILNYILVTFLINPSLLKLISES